MAPDTRYSLFVELIILLPFAFRRRCYIWFRKIFWSCWVKVEWPWFSNQGFCRLRMSSIFHNFSPFSLNFHILKKNAFVAPLFSEFWLLSMLNEMVWIFLLNDTVFKLNFIFFLLFSLNICCSLTLEITHFLCYISLVTIWSVWMQLNIGVSTVAKIKSVGRQFE